MPELIIPTCQWDDTWSLTLDQARSIALRPADDSFSNVEAAMDSYSKYLLTLTHEETAGAKLYECHDNNYYIYFEERARNTIAGLREIRGFCLDEHLQFANASKTNNIGSMFVLGCPMFNPPSRTYAFAYPIANWFVFNSSNVEQCINHSTMTYHHDTIFSDMSLNVTLPDFSQTAGTTGVNHTYDYLHASISLLGDDWSITTHSFEYLDEELPDLVIDLTKDVPLGAQDMALLLSIPEDD